jgi:A/G-specific adenine glycosylase
MTPKPPPLVVTEACALVAREGRWLIVQRASGGLWEQFWEFPTIHRAGADPAGRSFGAATDLAEGVRRLTGVNARIGPLVATIRYTVTRHRVELEAYRAVGLTEPLTAGPGLMHAAWETPERLASYPFSSAGRRLASWVVRHGDGPETAPFAVDTAPSS